MASTTTISSEEVDRMVEGSMARGPFYSADTTVEEARARISQMLGRAGIKVTDN